MTVGEKIKYFRTMHGFTQEQLVQATWFKHKHFAKIRV